MATATPLGVFIVQTVCVHDSACQVVHLKNIS